jgi:NAD(P)-dependent dehydrogenase (short-subunit alcohol dehydrogenase family)
MSGRLQDKVALITGAAGAIGSDMARLFAAEGAAVVIADILGDPAASLAAEICSRQQRAIAAPGDITKAADVERMFQVAQDTFGGLDILVNNAIDITGDTTIAKLQEEAFDHVVGVCLKGPFLCTRRAMPMLQARNGGSIVTISSVNALFGVGHTAYTAAKGALISMMRLVAAEYGRWNIRSNIICPGTIETNTSMSYWRNNPDGFQRLLDMYPMKRIGTTRDVASLALYLASDESKFVTGSVQVIDGGLLAGRSFDEWE